MTAPGGTPFLCFWHPAYREGPSRLQHGRAWPLAGSRPGNAIPSRMNLTAGGP